jgi:gamma-glutamylputrescine oxidase
MSVSYWQSSNGKKQIDTDFLIVGGGIAGFSSAYWLEKKYPDARITIVERHKMGSGASGRNAGFVTCGSSEHFAKLMKDFGSDKAVEIWKFSEENRELLKTEIVKNNADRILYSSTGSCTVAPSDADYTRYQDLVQTMTKLGIAVELLDENRMKTDYAVKGFKGGIEYKHDGEVHPLLLLKEIQSQLKRTQLIEDQEVCRVESGSDVFVETQHIQFHCKKVLLTLNGYLGLFWPKWQQIVRPQRGQVIVTEPLPKKVKGPCYLTKHLCYFRQMPTGELLIGGFRNMDLENENTYIDQVSDKIQAALFDFTKNFFDFTANAKIKNQWSGLMGFTPDGQMIIGEVPELKNVHLMAGCSGHGMGLSFNAAKVLVESIDGGAIPGHLQISRFP